MLFYFLGISALIVLLFLLIAYYCYSTAFKVDKSKCSTPYKFPDDPQYIPHHTRMKELIDDAVSFKYEEVYITSHDGYKLYGRYYEQVPGAPVEILVHGYRSNAYREFCRGVRFYLELGYNVLLIDQRAHGKSEGKCLSFGILERLDCLSWAEYIVSRCGKNVQIVLTGLSMGAATVLMASELDLPKNVCCIVADSGYTSPRDIIRKVIPSLKYPVGPAYFFVRVGGRIYGGFDIESACAVDAVKNSRVPILFLHGEDDRFVPCEMSEKCYDACTTEKIIKTFPAAGHCLSYLIDETGYLDEVKRFIIKHTF